MSNSLYTPDSWVIVEITSEKYGTVRKILAGWGGGYTQGESWKLSSGNLPEYIEGDYIIFQQESGSTYKCHKNCQRLSGYTSNIYAGFVDSVVKSGATIKIVDYV